MPLATSSSPICVALIRMRREGRSKVNKLDLERSAGRNSRPRTGDGADGSHADGDGSSPDVASAPLLRASASSSAFVALRAPSPLRSLTPHRTPHTLVPAGPLGVPAGVSDVSAAGVVP
jgi:hypothetical protein